MAETEHPTTPGTPGRISMMPSGSGRQDQHRAIATRYVQEIWNKGDLSALAEIVSPDFVYHEVSSGRELRGHAALKEKVANWRRSVPDHLAHIEEILADGDALAVRFTLSGTIQEPYHGLPATGQTVTYPGLALYRFKDGKLSEESFFDPLCYRMHQKSA